MRSTYRWTSMGDTMKAIKSCASLRLLLTIAVLGMVSNIFLPPNLAAEDPMNAQPSAAQVYFYPKAGQTPEQQDRDRYECYNWAVSQTGFNPSVAPLPVEERIAIVPAPSPGHDTAVGAVAGAFIGALAGGPRHALGGAAIGAGTGALVGAASDSSKQNAAARIEESNVRRDQARYAQFQAKALDFRRAMSACLEGRGYSVQ
jgi:hypothetical protein